MDINKEYSREEIQEIVEIIISDLETNGVVHTLQYFTDAKNAMEYWK